MLRLDAVQLLRAAGVEASWAGAGSRKPSEGDADTAARAGSHVLEVQQLQRGGL